jgi:hypothetical protein
LPAPFPAPVAGDLADPCLQHLGPAELAEVQVRDDEGLLGDLLGVLAVVQLPTAERVDAFEVAAIQLLGRCVAATADRDYERPVVTLANGPTPTRFSPLPAAL